MRVFTCLMSAEGAAIGPWMYAILFWNLSLQQGYVVVSQIGGSQQEELVYIGFYFGFPLFWETTTYIQASGGPERVAFRNQKPRTQDCMIRFRPCQTWLAV